MGEERRLVHWALWLGKSVAHKGSPGLQVPFTTFPACSERRPPGPRQWAEEAPRTSPARGLEARHSQSHSSCSGTGSHAESSWVGAGRESVACSSTDAGAQGAGLAVPALGLVWLRSGLLAPGCLPPCLVFQRPT